MTRRSPLTAAALGFVGGCLVTLGAAGLVASDRPFEASAALLIAGAVFAVIATLVAESAESERDRLRQDLGAARAGAERAWASADTYRTVAEQYQALRDHYLDLLRRIASAATEDLPPLIALARIEVGEALDPDHLQACPGGAYLAEPDIQDADGHRTAERALGRGTEVGR